MLLLVLNSQSASVMSSPGEIDAVVQWLEANTVGESEDDVLLRSRCQCQHFSITVAQLTAMRRLARPQPSVAWLGAYVALSSDLPLSLYE